MNLSQKIVAALDARPEISAFPCDVSVDDGTERVSLRLTSSGPVGLAFDTLEFATTSRTEWSPEALKSWSDRIVSRVTYLMEPLVVLEHDAVRGAVELRSHAPTARGDQRSFYEVHLGRQGTLSLARVAFDETTRRRRPASCQMTREVLERLTDDLVATIA